MAKYTKRIVIGYAPDGTQVRRRIYADTLTDLKAQELDAELQKRMAANPSAVTFGKYAEQWLETYKSTRSPQTQMMYRTKLTKCADIYYIPLKKLTKSDCQKVVNKCSDRPNTANKLAMMIMQILRSAATDCIIPPVTWKLERPSAKAPEKAFLTAEEIKSLDYSTLDEKGCIYAKILATFGLRPAEALALDKDSFDPDFTLMKIDKAVGFNKNSGYVKETKTGAVRTLPIPSEIGSEIASYFANRDISLLCPNRNGAIMSKTEFRRFSVAVCKALGISNLYILRHSVGTKLYYKCCASELSFKMAAQLMGHSEKMFIETYSHIDIERENISNAFL